MYILQTHQVRHAQAIGKRYAALVERYYDLIFNSRRHYRPKYAINLLICYEKQKAI